MRRFPTTIVIVLLALVGLIGGFFLFWPSERARYQAVDAVRNQRSVIRMSETISHAKGPIAREVWRLTNLDGVSTAEYEASNRSGSRIAHFAYPIKGYDVTFAFDALVRDGIWELQSRPQRTNTDDGYTLSIEQTAGTRSGKHAFSFTDPHYLATTAGRQYKIHLDKNKPVPDLLTLDSTSTADPRYQKVVDDFASFGPPGFRKTVAEAREKLLRLRRALRIYAALILLAAGFFALYEVVEAPQSGAFAPVVTHGSGRAIALTFDDGPTPGVTDALLAVLERERVPATFFVVGAAARREPGLLRRMDEDGDEIENHSDTHAHLNVLLPPALDAELDRANAAVSAATGKTPAFLRPPFGARNATVIASAASRGMRVVLWSVAAPAAADAPTTDAQKRAYAEDLAARVTDGDIVLLHDGDRGRGDAGELAFQADTVPYLISALRARGDRFLTVAQLLALP